jgi:hypothetical protein
VLPLSLSGDGSVSDAAVLFGARAAALIGEFEPSHVEQELIEQICTELDGLPLAIELAAARVFSLGLSELRRRVPTRLSALARPRGDVRHRSLSAVVAWSYELLTADERLLFERLSVFPDHFALAAVVEVCAGAPLTAPVDELLVSLVDKSLVSPTHTGVTRYRQLRVLRQFAATRLEARNEHEQCHARLIAYYVAWIEAADAGIRGPDERSWNERLDAEWTNVRHAFLGAVATNDVDGAASLVAHACWWASQRIRHEVGEWARTLLAMPDFERHPQRPVVLAACADFARRRNDWDAFINLLDAATACERDLGEASEPWVPARRLFHEIVSSDNDPPFAAVELRRRAVDSPFWKAYAAWADAFMVSIRLGHAKPTDPQRADDRYRVERCVQLARDTQNPSLIGRALNLLGCSHRATDPDECIDTLEQSLALATAVGNDELVAFDLWDLTIAQSVFGNIDEAADIAITGIRRYRRAGAEGHAWDLCLASLRVLIARGNWRTACLLIGRAIGKLFGGPTGDWWEEILPDDSDALLESKLGRTAMEQLITEGRATEFRAIIDAVEEALRTIVEQQINPTRHHHPQTRRSHHASRHADQ